MLHYTDDAQYLFKLLDQFEKCCGLKGNYTKTEAMWIGFSRNNTETPPAQNCKSFMGSL